MCIFYFSAAYLPMLALLTAFEFGDVKKASLTIVTSNVFMILFLTVLTIKFLIHWQFDFVKSVKQGNSVDSTFKIHSESFISFLLCYSSGSSQHHKFWIFAVAC